MAALDEEEPSRIDHEDGQTLIIVDIPIVVPADGSFLYDTVPLGIIMAEKNVVTVCLEETSLIEDFWNRRVRSFDTCKMTRLVLQLLYKTHPNTCSTCARSTRLPPRWRRRCTNP